MEEETPTYKKVTAIVVTVLIVGAIVFWHNRLSADFWPLDASRVGPNLAASVIQGAFILLFAALIWPPTRRRIHRFMDLKLSKVHKKIGELEERHETASKHRQELHDEGTAQRALLNQKLDHIIKHHPDVPAFRPRKINSK